MKVLSTDGLTKLIQLIKSSFISVNNVTQTTEVNTETTSEITLATVATSGSYNDLTNKPDLNGKADVDLSNLNSTGKSLASGLGMPSSRYIDLTLGATTSTYTAPANGYVYFTKRATAVGQFVSIALEVATVANLAALGAATTSNDICRCYLPVKKGQVFAVGYTAAGTNATNFKFYYAEGEENV